MDCLSALGCSPLCVINPRSDPPCSTRRQDSLKTEENMKRELKVRLALAGFLKDTLTEITNKKVRPAGPLSSSSSSRVVSCVR